MKYKFEIKRNNKVVAYLKLSGLKYQGKTKFDYQEIDYLWVEPEYRGKGLATKLLLKAKSIGTGLVCFVDPNPNSGLTYEQEKTWLIRNDFKEEKFDINYKIRKVMAFRP